MFGFGLEKRVVIEALGNSFQSAVECITMATSSPSENTHKQSQSIGCSFWKHVLTIVRN